MEIIVDGRLAALKKGSSFDYIAENRFFTDSDSYTLSMEFPLRGCPQNIEIFGHLHRVEVDADDVVFDCEIRDKLFVVRGTLTVVGMSEVEVKCQFLEGRSAQNFRKDLDEIYLNELRLFSAYASVAENDNPAQRWKSFTSASTTVALPWVNNNSGNMQNEVAYAGNGGYQWKCTQISLQPYLLYLLNEIFKAVGLKAELTQLQNSRFRKLVVFNTLPVAWEISNYALALPHWSITEFLEELEKFFMGKFHIDYRESRVTFDFNSDALRNVTSMEITNVIDEFSADVTEEDGSDYQEGRNLKYADAGHEMWKYADCDWFIAARENVLQKESYIDIMADKMSNFHLVNGYDIVGLNKLYYAINIKTYCILRYVRMTGGRRQLTMQPVNVFGQRTVDHEKPDDAEEINIVPAWIDDTTEMLGQCVFLDLPDLENDDNGENSGTQDPGTLLKTPNTRLLETGSKEQQEFLDKIFVGFWDNEVDKKFKLPRPFIDKFTPYEDFTYLYKPEFSMRLNDTTESLRERIFRIDGKKKYTFTFLSKTIPNPRSVFYINNKKYLAAKIKAQFNAETGLSEKMQMECYRII